MEASLSKESDRLLNKLRIKILFEQNGAAQLSGIAVALLYLFLFRHKGSRTFLIYWSSAFATLTLVRFVILGYFLKYYIKFNRDFSPSRWENIFTVMTTCSGLIWGAAVCFGVPGADASVDSLMAYILAGVTAGAAVAYSASLRATYSFFIPSVIPFAFKLAFNNDEVYWGMAGMLFAYTVVFLKLTHKFNQYAINSISMSFQKEKLIEEIRQMQAHVTQSAQMTALGSMSGGMAHEINNPLAIIRAAAEQAEIFLKSGTQSSPEPILKGLKLIEDAADRIAFIVKELRTFSGRSKGEGYNVVELRKIMETVTNFCGERFKTNGVRLIVGSIQEGIKVECRPYHMAQAILNLVSNAFDVAKESKDDKWVKVEAVDLDDKVEISVTDCGPGIPEEIRSKIMQPFFTTKQPGKGVGLGLNAAKGIIDDHQGKLWLDAGHPNTRFMMSIPKFRKDLTLKAS